MGVLALNMAIVLIGIPISYAFHTHEHEQIDCASEHGHDHHLPDPTSEEGDCDLCAFYAFYAPKDAEAFPIYSFEIFDFIYAIHVDKLRFEQPCSVFVDIQTTRGPPASRYSV